MSQTLFLDKNKTLPLRMERHGDEVRVSVDLALTENGSFRKNILNALTVNGFSGVLIDDVLAFEVKAGDAPVELQLNDKDWMTVAHDGGQWLLPDDVEQKTLTVFEMRMLAASAYYMLPYAQPLDAPKPITDLHTHLSAQISAKDLIEAAAEVGSVEGKDRVFYPVDLLELAGVNTKIYKTTPMLAYEFVPTKADGLPCEQGGNAVPAVAVADLNEADRAVLASRMAVSDDKVFAFSELEKNVYRFRNPLTKNPAMLGPVIQKIAEDYARQGVEYSELAVTGALKPDWLEQAIPALQAAEESTGVQLRLLAAIPRSLPPEVMLQKLQMVKYAAQSPYVVGVDFLGYESNKTKNFGWALDHIARWAQRQMDGAGDKSLEWDFPDNFTIRVHAGENSKNVGNVSEVLEVLSRYDGVRGRIGHGVYSDSDTTLALAQKLAADGRVAIEFNPDSNIALNNLDYAGELPIKHWIDAGVPVCLASDGAGAYHTNAPQSGMVGAFAGLDGEDAQKIKAWEQGHIAHQGQLFADKKAAFDAKYPDTDSFIAGMREHGAKASADVSDKKPILIAGASGDSWKKMNENQQAQAHIAMEMLVQLLDPEKVYFAMGRVKDEGVGNALDVAVNDFNISHPDSPKFYVMGILQQAHQLPKLARSVSHIEAIQSSMDSVPQEMMARIGDRDGHAIFIGGNTFTRDFIKFAGEYDISYGLMQDANGASRKAALLRQGKVEREDGTIEVIAENVDYNAQQIFRGAVGMVQHLANEPGGADLFLNGVVPSANKTEAAYSKALLKCQKNEYIERSPEEDTLTNICQEATSRIMQLADWLFKKVA